MRLSVDQVKQGLLHEDQGVRQLCLRYFTGSWSRDESVMPLVMQAIELHGKDTFEFFHNIDQLQQTDQTLEWIIRSLRETPQFFDDTWSIDWRPFVLANASGRLLARHLEEVLAVLADSKKRDTVTRRAQLVCERPAALWERLEAICEDHKATETWDGFPQTEADDLVTSLAELRDVPVDRMMELLRETPPDGPSALMWLEPLLIRLAGLIRHEPALPAILDKLRLDYDMLSEESQRALVRLGTDDVIRAVDATFLDEEWSWQLFTTAVFEHIHSDEAIRVGRKLLTCDPLDEDHRQYIAHGLVCQLSTESLDTVCDYLERRTDWLENIEWTETIPTMMSAARLLQVDSTRIHALQVVCDKAFHSNENSKFDFYAHHRHTVLSPKSGEADIDDENEFENDLPVVETIIRDAPRVGRNDPCPCGSGKKFKKCCINNVDAQ